MARPAAGETGLIRLQALSGLLFATFLILHLANTIVGAAGQDAYDGFLGGARLYYQNPWVEIGAIGVAGVTHIATGAVRMLRRRRRRRSWASPREAAPGWLRLHRISGWFLLIVIAGHFAATRGPGLWVDMPAEFSYLTFSLGTWPVMMYPYYFLLFGCGVFHLLHGGVVALAVVGLPIGPPTRGWTRVALVLALIGGAAGIFAMGAAFEEVDTARFAEYRDFYERYVPFMVTWE